MIVLYLECHGIYGFNDFHINFSYPKKIVNSMIEHENLKGRERFRYKKNCHIDGSECNRKDQSWEGVAPYFQLYDRWKCCPSL